ncbi:MAG: HAD family hydrolase [Acidobacteria bacterium]|nr:HAD family hydrolase [Acidobacteriota bacterium]
MTQQPVTKKLLVLDLDETLFFASEARLAQAEDFVVGDYFVYLRPQVKTFLLFCQTHFDVAVWTASTESYAAEMIARLFANSTTLRFVWGRKRCTYRYDAERQEQYWIKDLKKVRRLGYDLANVIAIDDTTRNWERTYGNVVAVKRFVGEADDDELRLLISYLDELRQVEDVRTIEKRHWRALSKC